MLQGSGGAKSAQEGAAAEKKSSSVKLTAFCLYRPHRAKGNATASVEALQGALDARLRDDGHVELLAGSVPFRSESFGAPPPAAGCGMLMLYGIRDSIEELYRWRNHARQVGAEFAHAEFEVDVGHIEAGLVGREHLKAPGNDIRFVNLRRMHAQLQGQILQTMRKYEPDMTRVIQLATRPDLFDRVFEDDPDIKNVDVFVIPIADDPESPNMMRQVAYVRPGAKILSVRQGSDQATIYLPSWMTNDKEAKKLRKENLGAS